MSAQIVDGIEFAGIEFLVQEGTAIVREAIETSPQTFDEAVFREFRQPVARVVSGGNVERLVECMGCEIPLISHRLHDALVDRAHPLRALSNHIFCSCGSAHIGTGGELYEMLSFVSKPINILFTVSYTVSYFTHRDQRDG